MGVGASPDVSAGVPRAALIVADGRSVRRLKHVPVLQLACTQIQPSASLHMLCTSDTICYGIPALKSSITCLNNSQIFLPQPSLTVENQGRLAEHNCTTQVQWIPAGSGTAASKNCVSLAGMSCEAKHQRGCRPSGGTHRSCRRRPQCHRWDPARPPGPCLGLSQTAPGECAWTTAPAETALHSAQTLASLQASKRARQKFALCCCGSSVAKSHWTLCDMLKVSGEIREKACL